MKMINSKLFESWRIISVALSCMSWQMVAAQSYNSITVDLENDVVSKYLNEVTYTREDTSVIDKYDIIPLRPHDFPRPVKIALPETLKDTVATLVFADNNSFDQPRTRTSKKGDKEINIYNLVPQRVYYYKLMVGDSLLSEGEIHTEGQLRMIYVPGLRNIRDLGGWRTEDGRSIKYGKIIRGSELNNLYACDSADIVMMKDELGIAAELDMRAWYNDNSGISAFNFLSSKDLNSSEIASYYYTNDSGQLPEHLTNSSYLSKWRQSFNFIVNNLKMNRPVYIHCVYGVNRTGYMALFLEGLLGVGYDQLMKDYELSYFINYKDTKETVDPVIDYIYNLSGETLKDKFRTFLISKVRVSEANVDYFIDEMLEQEVTTGITTDRRCVREQKEVYYNLQGMMVGDGRGKNLLIERRPDGSVIKYVK